VDCFSVAADTPAVSPLINFSPLLQHFLIYQDSFPFDEKAVQYSAIVAAGMACAFWYFYFRETGMQISWKDFVHHYLNRGLVRGGECSSSGIIRLLSVYCFNRVSKNNN